MSTFSDARLITDVTPLDNESIFNKVMALALKKYRDFFPTDNRGPTSQDLYTQFPDMVQIPVGDDGITVPAPGAGWTSTDLGPWTAILMACIQWLGSRVSALTTGLATATAGITTAQTAATNASNSASAASGSASSASSAASSASTAATAASNSASAAATSAASALSAVAAKISEAVVSGDLGTLTWSGVLGISNPSGTISKKHKGTTQGTIHTGHIRVKAATPGALITGLSFPLPTGWPLPVDLPNQEDNSWVVQGTGGVLAGIGVALTGITCGIWKVSSGVYEFRLTSTASIAANSAIGWISYNCAAA